MSSQTGKDSPRNECDHGGYRLYNFEETPTHLRSYFVLTGYRVYLTYEECIRSGLRLHNETMNIWTHIVAWLIFIFLTIDTFYNRPFNMDIPTMDYYMIILFFISAQLCFLFSSIFHLFLCHSKETYVKFAQLDYNGISIFIGGCMISSCYFGYYCFPTWQMVYSSVAFILAVIPVTLSNFRFYHMPNFQNVRISLFLIQVSFGLIPLFHWVSLVGFESKENEIIFFRIITLYIILSGAFFFFFTNVPERFSPGKFDLFFSSHQIWHVLTFLSAYYHYSTLILFLESKTTFCPTLLAPEFLVPN